MKENDNYNIRKKFQVYSTNIFRLGAKTNNVRWKPLPLYPYLWHLTTWEGGFQGFFSKFLMGGGTQNFRSPSVPDGNEVGWGTCEKNPTEAKIAHLMQN